MNGGNWQAICFDFDGTLAGFTGDFDLLLDGLRVDLGLISCDFKTFRERLERELRKDGPVTLSRALTVVLEAFGLQAPGDLERLIEEALTSYADGVKVRPGASELLKQLRNQRVPLALLSNGPEDMQRAAIRSSGVERYFDVVLISGDRDVAVRKPGPRMFDLACTGLRSLPSETLMVGDDLDADIAGALAYGMPAVLVGERQPPSGALRVDSLALLADLLCDKVTS